MEPLLKLFSELSWLVKYCWKALDIWFVNISIKLLSISVELLFSLLIVEFVILFDKSLALIGDTGPGSGLGVGSGAGSDLGVGTGSCSGLGVGSGACDGAGGGAVVSTDVDVVVVSVGVCVGVECSLE